MGRKKIQTQTTEAFCPACGAAITLSATTETKRGGFWNWLTGGETDAHAYESTARQEFGHVAPAAMPAKPWTVQPKQPETVAGPLAPGEIAWRKWDIDDVRVPMLMGVVGVAPVVIGGLIIVGTWATGWVWLWWVSAPAAAFLFGAAGVFWVMIWPYVRHDETQLRIRERPSDALPVVVPTTKTKVWEVKAEVIDGNGRHTVWTEFEFIDNPFKWYEFFRAVASKRCNFSVAAAKEYSIDIAPIIPSWVKRLLVDPESIGPGKTPQLTRSGRALVRSFAATPPLDDDDA